MLTLTCSYEALPEGYGLYHNMVAGAFAGIAVSKEISIVAIPGMHLLMAILGTYRHVSS